MRKIQNEKLRNELNNKIDIMQIEYNVEILSSEARRFYTIYHSDYNLEFVDFSKSYLGQITLRGDEIPTITIALEDKDGKSRSYNDIMLTLLHEITHYIQYKEGQWGNGKRRRTVHGAWFKKKEAELTKLYDEKFNTNLSKDLSDEEDKKAKIREVNRNYRRIKNDIIARYRAGSIPKEKALAKLDKEHEIYLEEWNRIMKEM